MLVIVLLLVLENPPPFEDEDEEEHEHDFTALAPLSVTPDQTRPHFRRLRVRGDTGIQATVNAGQFACAGSKTPNPRYRKMKMTPALRRAFVRRSSRQILASSILALSAPLLHAATFTWQDTNLGVLNWSAGTWLPSTPTAGDSVITTDLIFNGSGATQYTANNDLANPFLLNTLTLNSTANVVETIGGSGLNFNADGGDAAAITQSGSGAFAISAPVTATTALTLGGAGTGVVTLSGVVGGGGGLNFTGGNWLLSNIANSYTGGTTIGTGAFVEISPAGAAPQSVSFAAAATSLLGGNGVANVLTLNGGTLKLTTKGAGSLALGTARAVTFGANGGTLDLTNTNTPGTQGGNIASGDLNVTLNSTAGNPAVIKFNGGQLGLSNNSATAKYSLMIEIYDQERSLLILIS